MNIDFEKIAKLMAWEKVDNETYEQLFQLRKKKIEDLPNKLIIDIQYDGGLVNYLSKKMFLTEKEIFDEVIEIFRMTINEEVFYSKSKDEFPTLYNFFLYVQKLDRSGRMNEEATKITEIVWHGEMMQKVLNKKVNKMFSVEPNHEEYLKAVDKLVEIYNFDLKDVDKLRYFVCQTMTPNLNPSLNKNLFFWAKQKETGKTTVARAIAAVLNGANEISGLYESNLSIEAQFEAHALPLGCMYNCVILDEAMPRDTRKTYGQIKTKITSNSIMYNPKHNRLIPLKVSRNYIWTTNNPPYELIQDDVERRFLVINFPTTPERMTFEEIYSVWKHFIINCQPENDWWLWGQSFGLVEGMDSLRKEEYLSTIVTDNTIENKLRMSGSYVSIGFFYNELEKGKLTAEERKAVKETVLELAEEFQPSRWRTADIIDGIIAKRKEFEFIEIESIEEGGDNYGLPF